MREYREKGANDTADRSPSRLGAWWRNLWAFLDKEPPYPLSEGETAPTEEDVQRDRARHWDQEGGK